MNCTNHTQKPAAGACVHCGKLFCEECLVEIEGRMYCKEHVSVVIEQMKRENELLGQIQKTRVDRVEDKKSGGINIHNVVTSKSSHVEKNKVGIFHSLLRLMLILAMMGLGLIGLMGLYYGEVEILLFSGFLFLCCFILFSIDVSYCNRRV